MLPAIRHLLTGYIALADEYVAQASTQESTITGLEEDAKYKKALQGLRLVAKHELSHLMQSLQSWRAAAMDDLRPRTASLDPDIRAVGRAKKVVLECLFLEPAMQLLEELVAPPTSPLTSRTMLGAASAATAVISAGAAPTGITATTSVSAPARPPAPPQILTQEHVKFCNDVQEICFAWLLGLDELVPYAELPVFRHYLFNKVAQTLGAISLVNVSLVGQPLMLQLKKLVNPDRGNRTHPDTLRAQILRLCQGMQYVQLSFGTEHDLRHASAFLEGVFPFNYTASVKKSQVHHAIIEMLTKMLTPLVVSGLPHMSDWLMLTDMTGLMDWYNIINKYKDAVWAWMQKHDKHTRAGWPFATVLVCLLDSEKYTSARDSAVDFFLKQLKNKDYRAVAARCLVLLITSLLVRFGKAQAMPRPELVKLLDKMVRGPSGTRDVPCLLYIARKGYLSRDEIKEMISPWSKLAPDYVLNVLIELIQTESADCMLASLAIVHDMLAVAPPAAASLLYGPDAPAPTPSMAARLKAARLSDGGMATGALPSVQTQELMRVGYHPVDLLGLSNLMSRFTAVLSKAWQTWHTMYGHPAVTVNPDNQRERSLVLSQLRELLRLVPYTRPETWVGLKPLEMLPGYLSHPELQGMAMRVLEELVLSSPHLRNQVVVGVAAHCVALPDDSMRALREGLLFLQSLLNTWITCVKARAAGEVEERSTTEASVVDLHRLEGAVWAAGLCCHDEQVRDIAIQVLSTVRNLHQQLLSSPPYQTPPVPALLATHLSAMPLPSPSTPLGVAGASGHLFNDTQATNSPLAGTDPALVTRSKSATAGQLMSHASYSGTGRASGSGVIKSQHLRNGHASYTSSQDGGDRGGGHTGGSETVGSATPLAGGLVDFLEPDVTYMYDVLEQSGVDMVCASYWDWGDLSDLWTEYLDVPADVSRCIQLLVSPSREADAKLRLTRLMIELAKTMAVVSPLTCAAALFDLCVGRLARLAVRDRETGRMGLPQDTVEGVRRAEMWRYSGAVAAALPAALKDSLAGALTVPVHTAGVALPSSVSSGSLSLFGGSTSNPSATAAARAAAASGRVGAGLSMRDVLRCHMSLAFPGASTPSLQTSSVMALGHTHVSHHELVLEEVAWLHEECSGNKPPRKGPTLLGLILAGGEGGEYSNKGGVTSGRSRAEESRRVIAHIMRLLAVNAPPEVFASMAPRPLRWRLQEWVQGTWRALADARPNTESFWDNIQVAYCLAAVMKRVAAPLCDSLSQSIVTVKESGVSKLSGPPGPTLRRAIWDTLCLWTAEGQNTEREYRTMVRSGIRNAVDRARSEVSEPTARREDQERELRVWAAALDHRARTAMAAILQGPVFDADTRRTQGPVLQWVDRLMHGGIPTDASVSTGSPAGSLAAASAAQAAAAVDGVVVPGPPRVEVARLALLNLLRSNLDMFGVYLDKSYDKHPVVASTYFQALCEVYCCEEDVVCAPHILVSLILYKMVDPRPEVREDARHLLRVLAERAWGSQPSSTLQTHPSLAAGLVSGGLPSPRRLKGRTSAGGAAAALASRRSTKAGAASEGGAGTPPQPLNRRPSAPGAVGTPRTGGDSGGALQSTPNSGPARGTDDAKGDVKGSLQGSQGLLSGKADPTAGDDVTGGGAVLGVGSGGILSAWLPPDGGLAFSTLLDTYQDNQHNMSEMLASGHPELSEALCEEMMTRTLDCNQPAIQQPVLNSLVPWMNILIIVPQWKNTWCERLLKSMYYVTQRHGSTCPYEIQNLWCTLAALKDNVRHMLLFLVDLGMEAGQQDIEKLESDLAVVKRICLYLARTHPQFTIDQLQLEVSKQIQESDASLGGPPNDSPPPIEFETLIGDTLTSTAYVPDASAGGLSSLAPSTLDSPWPPHLSQPPQHTQDTLAAGLYDATAAPASDWRLGTAAAAVVGAGDEGSHRTTHSVEGGVGPNAGVPGVDSRLESATSSVSSVAPSSLNDSAMIHTAQSRPDLTRTSPRIAPSLVSSSGGALPLGAAAAAADAAAATDARSAHDLAAGAAGAGGMVGGFGLGVRGSFDVGGGGMDMSVMASKHMSSGMPVGATFGGATVASGDTLRHGEGGRTLITRPELAMCLLSEVAFACDEEFMREGCLPLLLHACCVVLDSESPLVHNHAALLLTALAHSVGSYHQEQAQEQGTEADMTHLHNLVRFLQSMRGSRLWVYEDLSCARPDLPSYTALNQLVNATVKALGWIDDLPERWAAHAMDWALYSHSRHLSGRSFQVFRALSPPLDGDLLTTLLLCLHTCLDAHNAHRANAAQLASAGAAGDSAQPPKPRAAAGPAAAADAAARVGADCALDALATLQTLVTNIQPPSRLVLYPQVFWVGLSLLHSHVVALYSAGLSLLAAYMKNLNLQQSKVLNVLLAAAPGMSGHILVHASTAANKLLRNSDKGGPDAESEEAEPWALGSALLQLPVHDTSSQRHVPIAAQQLLLRGLQLAETAPPTLHALADMAAVLEAQGAALLDRVALRDTTNTYLTGGAWGHTYSTVAPDNTMSGSGGPYDSLRKHRMLRLDAHQALLGPSHSQLFVTCLAVVLYAQAANNTSVTSAQSRQESPAAQAALARCLVCLSRACDAHGLEPLVQPLQQAAHVWADGGTGVPLSYPPTMTKPALSKLLLKQLCAGMAAAFLPRYGPLLLHHCLHSLSQAQPANKHLAVMQLLQALFSVLLENIEQQRTAERQGVNAATHVLTYGRLPLLGPSAMRILTQSSLLAPLLDKTQGPLATAATDALSAIVAYTAARYRSRGSVYGGLDAPLAAGSFPGEAPGSGAGSAGGLGASGSWVRLSQSGQEPPLVAKTLYPAPVSAAAAIKRVIDTLGHNVWRGHRVAKLLPYLSSLLRAHEAA